MHRGWRVITSASLVAAVTLLLGPVAEAGKLEEAIKGAKGANAAAAKSQAKVEKLSDETSELFGRYRSAQEQIESLRVYNGQLDSLVAAQNEEVTSLRDQIDRVATVARELMPLMARMVDSLSEFVELDVPFLLEERRGRVAKLRELMLRADVTNAEKYRRLIEAYQIENEYGRTIESYQAEITDAGRKRTFNFLRVGRVVLIYQSLDEKDAAVWDQGKRAWSPLPTEYRSTIKKALRIARKQAAPDLLRLPILAPGGTP